MATKGNLSQSLRAKDKDPLYTDGFLNLVSNITHHSTARKEEYAKVLHSVMKFLNMKGDDTTQELLKEQTEVKGNDIKGNRDDEEVGIKGTIDEREEALQEFISGVRFESDKRMEKRENPRTKRERPDTNGTHGKAEKSVELGQAE